MLVICHIVCCKRKPVLSCFSTERKEAESASLKCQREAVWQTERGGTGVCTGHCCLPATLLHYPPCQCKMPETDSERELLTVGPRPPSVQTCWNQDTTAEAIPWPLDFCLMHLALTFFITLYKGRKSERFSTLKSVI